MLVQPTTSVLFIAVVGMAVVCIAEMNFGKNQDDYHGFLDMIDQQNEKDKSRENEFFYRGNEEDVGHYRTDRHGQAFVTCRVGLESGPLNYTRCRQPSGNLLPACFLAHVFTTDETLYGCYDISKEDKTCNEECILEISQHHSEETRLERVVGFCCCTTEECNEKSKKQVKHAIDKYNRHQKHHHHRHPKNLQQSSGFLEPFRQL